MWHQVNCAWSQVIDLFVLIDEMRDNVTPQSLRQKDHKPTLWKELCGLKSGKTRLKNYFDGFPDRKRLYFESEEALNYKTLTTL